jgi:hypothetical protein
MNRYDIALGKKPPKIKQPKRLNHRANGVNVIDEIVRHYKQVGKVTRPKAKNNYHCYCCSVTINSGDRYTSISYQPKPNYWASIKICNNCAAHFKK